MAFLVVAGVQPPSPHPTPRPSTISGRSAIGKRRTGRRCRLRADDKLRTVPPRELPSRTLYQGRDRAGARSFLYAIGLSAADIDKPFVGVSNCWLETMPCNFGLRELAAPLKRGIKAAGANPMEFNTIAISDGITMGTEGMKAPLVSREIIADSIELIGRAHMFDALVGLCACDKTIPGTALAFARLDRPSVLLYGGSIQAGYFRGRQVAVGDLYEAVGAVAAGKMSEAGLAELEQVACPGALRCFATSSPVAGSRRSSCTRPAASRC